MLEEQANPNATQKTWMSVLQSKKIPVMKTDAAFSFCDTAEVVAKYPEWNAEKNSYKMDPKTMP